jgi:hypothetical protein
MVEPATKQTKKRLREDDTTVSADSEPVQNLNKERKIIKVARKGNK